MQKNFYHYLNFIFLFVAIVFSNSLFSQKNYNTYFDTIPNIDIANLNQLDSVVNNYTVFFTGENHLYANQNSNIELKMLKYLNEKAGVRNLIIELGFSRGYMINQYINNDSTWLKNLEGTTSSKYLNLYKKLRDFNLTLPAEKKISVHGIDVERFADDGPVLLNKLIPLNITVPKAIEFQIEVLKSYAYYIGVKYKSNNYDEDQININSSYYNNYYGRGFNNEIIIDSIIADYKLNKTIYKEFIGEKFDVFDKVFKSIIDYRKWQNYISMPHQYIYRERMIYDNLSQLILANPNEKYYGQFGRCHISQTELKNECNWYAFNSTAKRLNEGVAKGKTLSIGIFYQSNYSYSKSNFFEDTATTRELKPYLDVPCSKENVLVKINAKDTHMLKHFQFIMINNIYCDNKFKMKKIKLKEEKYDFHEWAVMLDFGAGISNFNFKNLSEKMLPLNTNFKNQIFGNSFGYTYSDFGNYNVGKFELFNAQSANNGNFKYKLSGYSISEGYGYSPHISNRFTFGLYGIFSFQRMVLFTQNDSLNIPLTPGFSLVGKNKFINQGIGAGVGLDLRFALTSWLGLYARGKYMVDLSKKDWRLSFSNNSQYINSPSTSLSNFGINFGLSILIQE